MQLIKNGMHDINSQQFTNQSSTFLYKKNTIKETDFVSGLSQLKNGQKI